MFKKENGKKRKQRNNRVFSVYFSAFAEAKFADPAKLEFAEAGRLRMINRPIKAAAIPERKQLDTDRHRNRRTSGYPPGIWPAGLPSDVSAISVLSRFIMHFSPSYELVLHDLAEVPKIFFGSFNIFGKTTALVTVLRKCCQNFFESGDSSPLFCPCCRSRPPPIGCCRSSGTASRARCQNGSNRARPYGASYFGACQCC